MQNYMVHCEKHGDSQIYGDGDTSCPKCEAENFAECKSCTTLRAKLDAAVAALKDLTLWTDGYKCMHCGQKTYGTGPEETCEHSKDCAWLLREQVLKQLSTPPPKDSVLSQSKDGDLSGGGEAVNIIHRQYSAGQGGSYCAPRSRVGFISALWDEVTCKKCLAKRPKKAGNN